MCVYGMATKLNLQGADKVLVPLWYKMWPLSDCFERYEKVSHWLGLDDLFATSKPNKCEIFQNFRIQKTEIGQILYYIGGQYFVRTLYTIIYYILGSD